jgi:hypothetical protein
LPDAGNSVLMIESDNDNGLWVVGASGNVTHIKMVVMNYRDKAETMNDMTEQFVMRQGLASGASFDGPNGCLTLLIMMGCGHPCTELASS